MILSAVQCIIHNMVLCNEEPQQQSHCLQSNLNLLKLTICINFAFTAFGFGGLWRFAGPFSKSESNLDNAELFVNCLEAMVETCLTVEENENEINNEYLSEYSSTLSLTSTMNLSSSISSVTPPNEKEHSSGGGISAGGGDNAMSIYGYHNFSLSSLAPSTSSISIKRKEALIKNQDSNNPVLVPNSNLTASNIKSYSSSTLSTQSSFNLKPQKR